jgi:hypothetical protein
MLKNYLKIALRNLSKYKGYTIINVGGLATARWSNTRKRSVFAKYLVPRWCTSSRFCQKILPSGCWPPTLLPGQDREFKPRRELHAHHFHPIARH